MSKKILAILIAVVVVLGLSKLSFAMMCGSHAGFKHTAQAESTEHIQAQPEATTTEAVSEETVNVGNKICPVSGEKIDEKMKTTYEYEGKIYNFCCAMCIEEFKKDPQKYIKKVDEELQAESEGQPGHEEYEMGMMQESGTSPEGMHEGQHH